jgi:O-antigen/teichoic acid export membrane protein
VLTGERVGRAVKLRRLARGSRGPVAGSLVAGFYGQAALVVTGVLTARALGPTDRGYHALLLLVPTILLTLGTIGLPLATTVAIAREPANATLVRRAIRLPALVQLVVLTVVQVAVLWVLVDSDPSRVQTAALVTLPFLAGALGDVYGKALLQGEGRYATFNVFRCGPVTLYLVGVVTLVAIGQADLVTITAVAVGGGALAGLVTLWVALRARPREPQAEAGVSRGQLFRFGLRGYLGAASPVDAFRVDQAVIGVFLPPRALGLYVVALAFTNLPSLISRSIGMIALPQVASRGRAESTDEVWRFLLASSALIGLVVVALELTAGVLVPLVFGSDFEDAVAITRILLLGSLFYGARRVLSDSVSGSGRPGLGSIAELASWIVLVILLPIVVPLWGVEGVASAMAIASAVSLLFLVVVFRRSISGEKARRGPAASGFETSLE